MAAGTEVCGDELNVIGGKFIFRGEFGEKAATPPRIIMEAAKIEVKIFLFMPILFNRALNNIFSS